MANRRMIASDIWRDEFIGELDLLGRVLWIGLTVTCADDQGRFIDNAILIRADVFPLDDIPVTDIEIRMAHFAKAGKVYRYTAGGKSLVQIVNWWKYQTPSWASASKFQPPANWIDREKYHAAGNKIAGKNWDCIGGFTKLPQRLHSILPSELPSGIEDVKGDVKGEGNVKGEVEEPAPPPPDPAPDPFEILRAAIESRGILPSSENDVNAIIDLVNCGITKEDILAGIDWKAGNNNGKAIRYVSQVVGPAKTEMAKRLQDGNGNPRKKDTFTPSESY